MTNYKYVLDYYVTFLEVIKYTEYKAANLSSA